MTDPAALRQEADILLEKAKSYMPDNNLQKLRDAVHFAQLAHQDQLRKSGEPYFIHPLRTAEILTRYHVDEDTLISALLHDVPEDTAFGIQEVEKRFGKKIAYLVDGVTKLSKVYYRHDMEERQIESLKKLFIHSAEDLRVILIKLADRLHNMRTLRFITKDEKRKRIAKETMEIYVPIANLLDINEMRTELEDLCFQHLWPDQYEKLKKELEENTEERNFILEEMIHLAERELQKNKIEVEIYGRVKTLYSIFQKLQTGKSVANIDDLLAIRVIVPSRKDCYDVLGLIHRVFKPKFSRFKDYIAVPKPNGYQSIHTAVFGINSSIVEFQIRTKYMHLEAEYGIAAHYFYKYSNERELTAIMRQRASWVQKILEIQKDHGDGGDFLQNLKLDVFHDRIFIFTPKGDVIDLPDGASAVDFAYSIHTDVGNHAQKAEINGLEFPLTTLLRTGDTVRIITAKGRTVEREWLNTVKTNVAMNKIKTELKKLSHEEKLTIGKRALQKEFDHIGKNFPDVLSAKNMKVISRKYGLGTLDDLLVAIAEGSIHTKDILTLLERDPLTLYPHIGIHTQPRKEELRSRICLRILGDNQQGQFREILRTLNALKIPILKYIIDCPWYFKQDRCYVSMLIRNYDELVQVFESLDHIEGIKKITRTFLRRKIIFYVCSVITLGVWIVHPLIVKKWLPEVQNITLIFGISFLFGLIYYINRLTRRSFPELQETKWFWPTVFLITTLALVTVSVEIFIYHLPLNWVVALGFILLVYVIMLGEYLNYREKQFE